MRPTSGLAAGMSDNLRTMASNSGWLFISTVVRIAAGFLAAVWLARYLGPTGFGVYSYVVSLVMIFAAVSSLGMNSLVTRELVETPQERDRILGSALGIRLVGGVVATITVVVLAIALHPDPNERVALIVFATVLLLLPFELVSLFYEARTQSRYVVWVQVPASLIHLAAVGLFVYSDLGVVAFLVARIGEMMLVQFGVLVLFWRQGYRPMRWRLESHRVRRLMSEAWPLVFSSLGAVLYLRIDQVMLGQIATARDVGIYAAAARLSEVWYVIPTLVVASAFPYLLRLRAQDGDRYAARLQQLYDLLAWLGLAVALIVTALAPLLVETLFGPEFADSVPILRIHVWAAAFIFMRMAFSKWLIAERLLFFSLVTQGLGAVVNVTLNLLLIPAWGGIGAAWATLASYAVASYFALLLSSQTRPAARMMTKAFFAPLRYLREGVPARA